MVPDQHRASPVAPGGAPSSSTPPSSSASCDAPDDDRDEPGTPPGWARWISRISLVIALVAMGATIWTVGLDTLVGHLRAIGWWFLAILALEVVITALDARALFVLACDQGNTGFGRVVFAQIAGRGVNAVTPSGTLGEATKASLLTDTMSPSRAVSAVLFSNVVNAVVQLAAVGVGAPMTAVLLPLPDVFRWGLVIMGVVAMTAAIGLTVLVRRGMLASLANVGVKLHVVSHARRARWQQKLAKIDRRLSGTRGASRRRIATVLIIASKLVSWGTVWLTLSAAGYTASIGELAALLSAGVVLSWIARIVPLGIGVAETGNYGLFQALNAPPAYGVALALASRINSLLYAAIGFALLGAWRASHSARTRIARRRARTRGGTATPTQGVPDVSP